MKKIKASDYRHENYFSYCANDFNVKFFDYDEIELQQGYIGADKLPLKVIDEDCGGFQAVESEPYGENIYSVVDISDDESWYWFYADNFGEWYRSWFLDFSEIREKLKKSESEESAQILSGEWNERLHYFFANEILDPDTEFNLLGDFSDVVDNYYKSCHRYMRVGTKAIFLI